VRAHDETTVAAFDQERVAEQQAIITEGKP